MKAVKNHSCSLVKGSHEGYGINAGDVSESAAMLKNKKIKPEITVILIIKLQMSFLNCKMLAISFNGGNFKSNVSFIYRTSLTI